MTYALSVDSLIPEDSSVVNMTVDIIKKLMMLPYRILISAHTYVQYNILYFCVLTYTKKHKARCIGYKIDSFLKQQQKQ
jgi:hypothetical protein